MASALCEAVLRCQVRRLVSVARSAPLLAALTVAVAGATPFIAWRAGAALGAELAPVFSAAVGRGIAAGVGLGAAAAGAALALAAPRAAVLGDQLVAAPVSRIGATAAVLAGPLVVFGPVAAGSALAGAVALGRTLPGGTVGGLCLAAAAVVTVGSAGLATEAILATWRVRSLRGLRPVLLAPGAFVVLLALPGSLAEGAAAPALLVASSWLAGALLVLWLHAFASRPPARPARHLPSGAVRRRRRRVSLLSALARLLIRRREARSAASAGLVLGLAGVALAAASGVPAPAPLLLGTGGATLASLLAPLLACGLILDGRWLWVGGAPAGAAIAARLAVVATAVSVVPVAVVALAASVCGGATVSAAFLVGGIELAAVGVALLVGTAFPWRATSLVEQASTVGCFGLAAVAAGAAAGVVGPRLVALGVPDPVAAGSLCGFLCLIGTAALASRLPGRTG